MQAIGFNRGDALLNLQRAFDEQVRLPDNGCALLPNGIWLMTYLATIPEQRAC